MEHNLPKLNKERSLNKQSSKNIPINFHLNDQNALGNSNNNESNSDSNSSKNLSLPLISENKRIHIHKPSDFVKNKYTFLGNLANNSELLSRENNKMYQSPKFSMHDIKSKMSIENQIIGSILKDEIDSLPSLLRNLIPSFNKNKTKEKNMKANSNKSELDDKEFNNINSKKRINNNDNDFSYINHNNKFLNGNNNYNNYVNNAWNRNDIKAYGLNAEQIAQRANRLVNLNFLVSSGRKRPEPFDDNMHDGNYNHKEIFGNNSGAEYSYQPRSGGKRANNFLMSLDYSQMQGMRK